MLYSELNHTILSFHLPPRFKHCLTHVGFYFLTPVIFRIRHVTGLMHVSQNAVNLYVSNTYYFNILAEYLSYQANACANYTMSCVGQQSTLEPGPISIYV